METKQTDQPDCSEHLDVFPKIFLMKNDDFFDEGSPSGKKQKRLSSQMAASVSRRYERYIIVQYNSSI